MVAILRASKVSLRIARARRRRTASATCALVARRPSAVIAKAVPITVRRVPSSTTTANTDAAAREAIAAYRGGVLRVATTAATLTAAATAAIAARIAARETTRCTPATTNSSSPKASRSPFARRRRVTGARLTKVPFVELLSMIHHARCSRIASAWWPLESGASDSVRTSVLPRLRPMRTRGPVKINSSPHRAPLANRSRSSRTLLLADRVFRRCRTGDLDDRELVLDLDNRAAAGLLLGRAELRAGVGVDQRFTDVDDIELVAHLDPGRSAEIDVGLVAFDLDDLAFDHAAGVGGVGDARQVVAAHQLGHHGLCRLVHRFAGQAPLGIAAERRVLHEPAAFLHAAVAGDGDHALSGCGVDNAKVDGCVRLHDAGADAEAANRAAVLVDVELINAAEDDVFDAENFADLRRSRWVDSAGLRQPLLLQDEVELVALDDAELAREQLVLRERGVDDVARRRTKLVRVPVRVRRVVVELPDRNFDLALSEARRRERDDKCARQSN